MVLLYHSLNSQLSYSGTRTLILLRASQKKLTGGKDRKRVCGFGLMNKNESSYRVKCSDRKMSEKNEESKDVGDV